MSLVLSIYLFPISFSDAKSGLPSTIVMHLPFPITYLCLGFLLRYMWEFLTKYVVYTIACRYVSKFIKKSERMSSSEEPEFTNLYVKNLGDNITVDHLQDKFSEYGKVSNVVIMKDTDGKSRGFGFVNFESPQAAKKAVEALNGTIMGKKKKTR